MPSETTHDSLLEAAKRVIQREGAGHLTLDAVAREAGVSKGGLLYHFPNKQALLRGIVAAGGVHMRQALDAQMLLAPGPQSFARAFLKVSVFGAHDKKMCKPPAEVIWSLIGATANDPSLLIPVQESQAEWGQRLADDRLDPDVVRLILLVGRGLWMSEIFGFELPDPAERQRLHDLIAHLGGFDVDETTERHMEEQ